MDNWAKWADGARGGRGLLRDSALFSPHKQEKPVSVCHNTQTHSHTALKDTGTASTQTHTDKHIPLVLSTIPPTNYTWKYPNHTHTHTTESSGFDWTRSRTSSNEPPRVFQRVCAESTGFILLGHMWVWICMGICHTGNKHYIYMMPKVTNVRREIRSLLGIGRHVGLCLEGVGGLRIMLMCERRPWRTFGGRHWLRRRPQKYYYLIYTELKESVVAGEVHQLCYGGKHSQTHLVPMAAASLYYVNILHFTDILVLPGT